MDRRIIASGWLVVVVAACDSPAPIGTFHPTAPAVRNSSTAVQTGVTEGGMGRAVIQIGATGSGLYDVEDGTVGVRARYKRSTDSTFTHRWPQRRYSRDRTYVAIDALEPETTYDLELVGVTNVGFESLTATAEWNDGASQLPLQVTIPAVADRETTAPACPGAPTTRWQGDAVLLSWNDTDPSDIFRYHVERQVDAGDFEPVGTAARASAPQFRDTGAAVSTTYGYRLIVEDLAGNLSAACPTVSITTPGA